MNVRYVVALALSVAFCACSSAPPGQEPEVTERGRYVVWYRGTEIEAELGFRWASTHLGDELLLLKLTLVAPGGTSTLVERNAVRARTPDGNTLALIDQSEFRRRYGELRLALDRIYAWEPPSYRFAGSREPCELWFLSPPGVFIDRSKLRITAFQWCTGPLVFQVPGGVQPGRWVLAIDLEESAVRIPFLLGE